MMSLTSKDRRALNYVSLRDFIVFEWYHLTQEEWDTYTGKKIPDRCAWVRHVYVYFCNKYIGKSTKEYSTIGKFASRHRTTVYHSLKKVSDQMDVDKAFRKEIADLDNNINSLFINSDF